MNILVINHRAPANHRLQRVIVDVDAPALAKVIFIATGGGMTARATAMAMETHQRIRELPEGESLHLKNSYLDMEMRQIQIDATFTRVED